MKNYVPMKKKSKKEQKEYYAQFRNTWNGLNPVTRTVPNGKGYNRKKMKNEDRRQGKFYENLPCFLLIKRKMMIS